jgi:hypothetical protein
MSESMNWKDVDTIEKAADYAKRQSAEITKYYDGVLVKTEDGEAWLKNDGGWLRPIRKDIIRKLFVKIGIKP